MAEYINKAELLNKRPEWLNTSVWNKEKSAHNNGWNDCNDEWLNTITELPTIDIVYCGECKWFDEGYTKCKMGNINGGNKTYFCADGEKEKRK